MEELDCAADRVRAVKVGELKKAPAINGLIVTLALCIVAAVTLLSTWNTAQAETPASNEVAVLEIDGAIGPAIASYVSDGLAEARFRNASLIVFEIDTPGGLDTSMRDIIQEILAMPTPVVVYVHPSGARAASAGTFIAYSSHVAAMTPGTNLGAATPVQIGSTQGSPEDDDGNPKPATASERKAVNDAVAYIRSLAELRGRNSEWAEEAVRGGASLSAEAALMENVIDIVAVDRADLLRQLDGRVIDISGSSHTIQTEGIRITAIEPDITDRILAVITDPNVALILMMVGIYGLIFEFMNPGALVPGTIGSISLVIGLYALAALPVDFAGASLIILGLALMIAEAFAPSFGILGVGGLVSFILGATLLVDTDVPEFQIDWSVITALGVAALAFTFLAARLGIRSHRQRIQTGTEEMIGAKGEVLDWNDGAGHVVVHSERWNARGPNSIPEGTQITVVAIDGLCLNVALDHSVQE